MASINAPTYEPTSTAAALAEKYTQSAQTQITNQNAFATATAKGLGSLGSAISTFQSALTNLAGLGKSMLAQKATLSDATFGSATAKAGAAQGTYSLFVEQIATASQVSYNGLADGAATGGTLKVTLSDESGATTASTSFDVDLSAVNADGNGDGTLSVRELAAAINRATGNAGKVSAGVVTVGTETRLVLTSKSTGVANTVSLDASGVTDATLQTGLGTRTIVAAAKDAVVWLGGVTGTKIQQASNTFSNIDGVSVTFTKAQAAGADPVTLTVAGDDAGTVANVQSFVDAYNQLKTAIDALVDAGDPSSGKAAGVFAHDAGVRSLQRRLVDLLRPSGALSLASYGITANRDGSLGLNSTRLNKQLAIDPSGLDAVIGSSSSTGSSGIAGSLNTYLNQWSNGASGQIKQRTEANSRLQADLTQRQTRLDAQYDSAYQRYLKQFTQLQTLQSTMNSNVSLFDALFSSDKSS